MSFFVLPFYTFLCKCPPFQEALSGNPTLQWFVTKRWPPLPLERYVICGRPHIIWLILRIFENLTEIFDREIQRTMKKTKDLSFDHN